MTIEIFKRNHLHKTQYSEPKTVYFLLPICRRRKNISSITDQKYRVLYGLQKQMFYMDYKSKTQKKKKKKKKKKSKEVKKNNKQHKNFVDSNYPRVLGIHVSTLNSLSNFSYFSIVE